MRFDFIRYRFIVLSLILSGCTSTSVLIHKDDATFDYSQDRLLRTSQIISKIDAPANERALFLQGEGFYRYRFEPPEQSSKSYLLEAASAITDFPGFQSFGGAISLSDIRIRASDSAVQIWESLLVHHPETRLRPVTLYRLGWAYRNIAAEGLPRNSPDEAFDELIKNNSDPKLTKLAIDAKLTPWKSKSAAATRSLLPGLGQLYVGETKSGVWRVSIAAVAALAVAYPFYVASRRGEELKLDKDWGLIAAGFGGLIALSLDYTSSYNDAMRGVVEWNERAERRFEQTHPDAP